MKRRLRVRLNMPLLIAHLEVSLEGAVAEDEVFQWLSDAGFTRQDETHWVVAEVDLGQLEPEEVLEVEMLDDD